MQLCDAVTKGYLMQMIALHCDCTVTAVLGVKGSSAQCLHRQGIIVHFIITAAIDAGNR
jgi:hypothetical protein